MTPAKVTVALILGLFSIASGYGMRLVFQLGLISKHTADVLAASLVGFGIFLLGFLVLMPLWGSLVIRGALREYVLGYAPWADWFLIRKRGE